MSAPCTEIEPLAAVRPLGVLEPDEEARVSEHLTGCLACRDVVAEAERALAAEASLPAARSAEATAPEVWSKVEARLDALEAAGGADVQVTLACTYCHGALVRPEAVYCASCLAPAHEDCFAQNKKCSAPGCGQTRVVRPTLPFAPAPARAVPATPPRRRRGVLFPLVALFGVTAAAAALQLTGALPFGQGDTDDAPPPLTAELARGTPDEVVERLTRVAPEVTRAWPELGRDRTSGLARLLKSGVVDAGRTSAPANQGRISFAGDQTGELLFDRGRLRTCDGAGQEGVLAPLEAADLRAVTLSEIPAGLAWRSTPVSILGELVKLRESYPAPRARLGQVYALRAAAYGSYDELVSLEVVAEDAWTVTIAWRLLVEWSRKAAPPERTPPATQARVARASPVPTEEELSETAARRAREESERLLGMFLKVDPALERTWPDFVPTSEDRGLARLLDETHEIEPGSLHRGASFSFLTRSQFPDSKAQLRLSGGSFSSGFEHELSAGVLRPLAEERDVRKVKLESCPGTLLMSSTDERVVADLLRVPPGARGCEAELGRVFAVRWAGLGLGDTLAAFQVIARDEHTATIAWRVLRQFPVPERGALGVRDPRSRAPRAATIPPECDIDCLRIRGAAMGPYGSDRLSTFSHAHETSRVGGVAYEPRTSFEWAFTASLDGKRVLSPRAAGFELGTGVAGSGTEHAWSFPGPLRTEAAEREVLWAPDGHHFLLWRSDSKQGGDPALALLDADALGPVGSGTEAAHVILARTTREREPFRAAWSVDGKAVYVAFIAPRTPTAEEQAAGQSAAVFRGATIIERVPLDGGAPVHIQGSSRAGRLFWVRPPSLTGPPERPDLLVIQSDGGLDVLDLGNGTSERIAKSVHSVTFSPGPGNLVAILDGGLSLCDLDHREKGKPLPLETVEPSAAAVQTIALAFSPGGKYLAWASPGKVSYRLVATGSRVEAFSFEEAITGCAWNAREDRLAVVAGNRVYVHDPDTRTTTEVARVGDATKTFCADPCWCGDDLLVGSFTDAPATPRERR